MVDPNILDDCVFEAPKAVLLDVLLKPPKVGVFPPTLPPPKAFGVFSAGPPNVGVEGIPNAFGASCLLVVNPEVTVPKAGGAAGAVPNPLPLVPKPPNA